MNTKLLSQTDYEFLQEEMLKVRDSLWMAHRNEGPDSDTVTKLSNQLAELHMQLDEQNDVREAIRYGIIDEAIASFEEVPSNVIVVDFVNKRVFK